MHERPGQMKSGPGGRKGSKIRDNNLNVLMAKVTELGTRLVLMKK